MTQFRTIQIHAIHLNVLMCCVSKGDYLSLFYQLLNKAINTSVGVSCIYLFICMSASEFIYL